MNPASLHPSDVASGSFLLLAVAMAATTVLLLVGSAWVAPRWKIPVALSSLVTLVATMHYVAASVVPVVYRYVDWQITVPLQVLSLYFFIGTVSNVSAGLFWRLLIASLAMILARYMGESDLMYPTLGFLIGLLLWLYVLGEVFFGHLSEINANKASDPVRLGFFWLRLIVTIGWALYPLCYLVVRLGSGADVGKLMVIYNLADLVNQIAFVTAILATAVNDTAHAR
jgi:bacteriorhodopsin